MDVFRERKATRREQQAVRIRVAALRNELVTLGFLIEREPTFTDQDVMLDMIEGFAEILEKDCDCPPCIGSDAPAEDLLGRAKKLLAEKRP